MIYVREVTLSLNETLNWTFSGLHVNVSHCGLYSVRIIVEVESRFKDGKFLLQNPQIIIHNSLFKSLNLNPATKAQITECYIDGLFKQRPTLITTMNSNVSIQNCQFKNFINDNGSTILFGNNNSHIAIENSVFIQHNGSKGILLLKNNSSMRISNSSMSHNVVSSRFSTITLKDGIHAVLNNSVFTNNSALTGGVMIMRNRCQVTLTNCTFSSNKAVTGKTVIVSKNSKNSNTARNFNQNNVDTFATIKSTFFNQTVSEDPVVIDHHQAHLGGRHSIFMKNIVQQKGYSTGMGGAIDVELQSQLLVTNCMFAYNSAEEAAGAIGAGPDVKLDLHRTRFVGNTALQGGAIDVQEKAHLRIINCVFIDNSVQLLAGAINAVSNVTLDIQETTFVGNKARQGGTIEVEIKSHIRITNCRFKNNSAEFAAGAIAAVQSVTVDIEETAFVGNKALLDSGAINVQEQSHLRIIKSAFDDNIAQRLGGAIIGGGNVVLDIQETNFTCNRAVQAGAIAISDQGYLLATNCTFEDNHSEELAGAITVHLNSVCKVHQSYFYNNSAAQQGGAIFVQQTANILITNSKLEFNFVEVGLGGAISIGMNSTSQIQKTNFISNRSPNGGGALVVLYNSECYIELCAFLNNTAKTEEGGAVYIESKSFLQVENTNFINNNSTDGGAIFVDSNSKLKTNLCNYWKNYATQSGGAIEVKGSSTVIIEGCNFLKNHAATGGAIDVENAKHVSVKETMFLKNVASDSGAVSIFYGNDVTIDNITCVGNHALGTGGCLTIISVTLTLSNSNISENVGKYGVGVSTTDSRLQVDFFMSLLFLFTSLLLLYTLQLAT